MMTTLVVGPFYLSLALGLAPAQVGLVMAAGPLISTLSGPLAGQATDRFGAPAAVLAGLAAMAAGAAALALLPASLGQAGYLAAMLVLTPGYQLFQAANNAAVLGDADPGQRGVLSGLLSLARNLGLITGAAVMGSVFARASAASGPGAVAAGFRTTFGVAAALVLAAAALALHARREPVPGRPDAGAEAGS
jgi:MFS family permease